MKKSDLKKEIQRLKEEFELYKKDHVCIERKKIFNEHLTENNGNIVYFENYKYGKEEIIIKKQNKILRKKIKSLKRVKALLLLLEQVKTLKHTVYRE